MLKQLRTQNSEPIGVQVEVGVGSKALRAFEQAHPDAQKQFWDEIRRVTERDHAITRRICAEDPHRPPRGFLAGLPRWNDTYERLSRYFKAAESSPQFNDKRMEFAQQRDRLRSIPATSFVQRLTGYEVPFTKKIDCPAHEETEPSCHVYEHRVVCFGCGFKGDIYDFAAALWKLNVKGSQFNEVHSRLMGVFG